MIPGVVSVKMDIYDLGILIKTLTSSTPNPTGTFNLSWTPTGLASGKVYTTITEITNATGARFKTPGSFEITAAKRLEEMQTKVDSVLDKPISQVSSELQSKLQAQTTTMETKLNEQTGIITTKTTEMSNVITAKTEELKTSVQTTLASFETKSAAAITKLQSGADQAVAAGEQVASAATELEATAKKYSWNATVSPNPALAGDEITLQVQGQPGLLPLVTIYSWDNKILMGDRFFKETANGLYAFAFKADERFTPGKSFTYVVSESVTGGLIAGSGVVESMSITTIAGLAAAAPEAEKAAKKALDAISAIEAMLISRDNTNIALTLRSLQASVDRIPSIFAKESESSKVTADTLNEISERLKKMAGEEGYDLSSILEQKLADSPTMKDVRTKTDRIQTTTGILLKLFEAEFGGEDAIVVSVGLEHGSVIFRIIAANPSKTKPQTVNIKQYLPQEVKPKDIMEIAGLDTEYDSEKGIYYVYRDNVTLNPNEIRAFEVEVEDIWVIADSELNFLKAHTDTIMEKVKNSEYYLRSKEVADTIYLRLSEIDKAQKEDDGSREQHIGLYRQNIQIVDKIKEDITRLEKMLATAGGPLAPEMLSKSKIKSEEPTKTMTWIVIFSLIIFTSLLAGVMFFTWNRQARITKDALSAAKRAAFPEGESKEDKTK